MGTFKGIFTLPTFTILIMNQAFMQVNIPHMDGMGRLGFPRFFCCSNVLFSLGKVGEMIPNLVCAYVFSSGWANVIKICGMTSYFSLRLSRTALLSRSSERVRKRDVCASAPSSTTSRRLAPSPVEGISNPPRVSRQDFPVRELAARASRQA